MPYARGRVVYYRPRHGLCMTSREPPALRYFAFVALAGGSRTILSLAGLSGRLTGMLSGLSGLSVCALPDAAEGGTTIEAAPSFDAGCCAVANPLMTARNNAAATRAASTHSIRFIRLSQRFFLQTHLKGKVRIVCRRIRAEPHTRALLRDLPVIQIQQTTRPDRCCVCPLNRVPRDFVEVLG